MFPPFLIVDLLVEAATEVFIIKEATAQHSRHLPQVVESLVLQEPHIDGVPGGPVVGQQAHRGAEAEHQEVSSVLRPQLRAPGVHLTKGLE